jgi:lipopolysaccharide transport system ATP-binding protein
MSVENEVLVRVNGVSKKFCRDLKKSLWYGVKDVASELLPFTKHKAQGTRHSPQAIQSQSTKHKALAEGDPALRAGEFWANKDISFELRRGECIGLIGHNGAGKTTLLKMLNGLIKPDEGKIEMRGRVGALIALGAGFNPILTGRENIYVNGSILGLTKREIDDNIEGIINFAEIHDFIDSPVQSYSSGMQVRLGFSVASSLSPDILILDEVLAVGDVGFRTKCYNRIYELRKTSAIIFVSHSMPQVDRLCHKSMVLSKGMEVFLGNTNLAIDAYNHQFQSASGNWMVGKQTEIRSVSINGNQNHEKILVSGDQSVEIEICGTFPEHVNKLEISINFITTSMDLISQANSRFRDNNIPNHPSEMKIRVSIPKTNLGSGDKMMSISVVDADTNEILLWAHGYWQIVVKHNCYIPAPSLIDANFRSI